MEKRKAMEVMKAQEKEMKEAKEAEKQVRSVDGPGLVEARLGNRMEVLHI